MSATVHFVVFADDGVISSEGASIARPKENPNLVQGQTGRQRFACGAEASKWWARTDGNGVLHVATGEPQFVSCEQCKKTKDWQDASSVSLATKQKMEAAGGGGGTVLSRR